MSKTISSRVDNKVHKELLDRCNNLGCTVNEFVAESVREMLYGDSEFKFEQESEKSFETIIDEKTIKEIKPQVIIRD